MTVLVVSVEALYRRELAAGGVAHNELMYSRRDFNWTGARWT